MMEATTPNTATLRQKSTMMSNVLPQKKLDVNSHAEQDESKHHIWIELVKIYTDRKH